MATESTLATDEVSDLSLARFSPLASLERYDGARRTISDPSSGDWEAFRFIFTRYYKGQALPLRVVRDIMARQYGFIAT